MSASVEETVPQVVASEREFTDSIVATAKTKVPAKKLSNSQDSDSGLEPTSSSSASNCSEDDRGEDDNQVSVQARPRNLEHSEYACLKQLAHY